MTAWSVTAYLGPWGICYQTNAVGTRWVFCPLTPSDLDSGGLWGSTERSPSLSVAGGHAPVSAAWVIVSQPNGTTTKIWPVTVGGQKLFAFQPQTGPNPPSWKGLRQLRARGQAGGLG